MGCAASKLDNEEAVRLCRDRKNFIKLAIELRNRFASDHVAYIQSLRRVSAALIHYVEAHDHNNFLFNSNLTPPLASVEMRLNPGIRRVPLKSSKSKQKKPMKGLVNYLRSGGNPSVSVEQAPEPEETERMESHHPINQHSGINYSLFALLWDHLWNPSPSLESYGYPSSFDGIIDNDDVDGLRQIREEEGIPELENVDGEKNKENLKFWKVGEKENEKPNNESNHAGVEAGGDSSVEPNQCFEKVPEAGNKSTGSESFKVSETEGTVDYETPNHEEEDEEEINGEEEARGYTVYVNRRPTTMAEVMRDIENQFSRIYKSAHEVSVMLGARRVQKSPVSSEQTGSLAARYRQASASSKEDINGVYSMVPARHKATLDRLYEWEKKLYEEVKAGEQVRIEYEKKCKQLSHHDIYGEEPSEVDQTVAAIRVLHTHFKVYICTVESISKRIEALRDAELCPQLMKLIQGLSRMWKTMADSYRIQKRTIEDAKLLPFPGPSVNSPNQSHATVILATEIQNWRRCFANWISTNRSYSRALAGWASRCTSPEAADAAGNRNALSAALSPLRGGEMPPVFGMCRRWWRLLESISEERAVAGMEFFAAGMASVSAQQREAERAAIPAPDLAAVPETRKMVLCTGMAVAVGSVAEFAGEAAKGYGALVRRCRG